MARIRFTSHTAQSMQGRILIVDDEPLVLDVLTAVLHGSGHAVTAAPTCRAAFDALAREPQDIVLCDIRMPDMDGFDLLREVRRTHPATDVVMMTGYGSLDGAVDAMALGAADYLIKPLKPKEVQARIGAVLERRRLEAEILTLQSELRARHHIHNVVAISPRMAALVSGLRRLALGDETAVLWGEPGTGRGFLARSLHYSSKRRDEPFSFVAPDASVEEARLELFGRRIGDRKLQRGQLDRARGGTVVLRDLERMPTEVQSDIGRMLRTRAWRPVDSDESQPLETRIMITLGNRVDALLESGALHPELAPLGTAVALHVPGLEERQEDLAGLIAGFLRTFGHEHGLTLDIAAGSVDTLRVTKFPGHVAQLFAVLSQCAALSPRGRIEEETLELTLRQAGLTGQSAWAPMAEHLGDREKLLVMRAVANHPGRLDQAAKELGISRTTLWRRMRKYGLQVPAVG